MKSLDKAYNPHDTEKRIWRLWEHGGYFAPEYLPARHKKPYAIAFPPPNITGNLHMGHALNILIQDAVIRYKRMQGYKTLWTVGTDHAGIATQNKVEKELKKEGKTRHDLGRKAFEKRVWEWREKYGDIILEQMKRAGASADFTNTRFTMDKDYTDAVNAAFIHYYKKEWIYRNYRVINWCPRCATSISDLEIESREQKGKLWYIKYPIKDSAEKFIEVATTRPETMLGDAAVAVNPKDERYKNLVGKIVVLPIQNREIPIIADRDVDPAFGTGAVKITPLHSMADWQIAQRHKLKGELVIDKRRKMTKAAGPICDGLNTQECREAVVAELKKQNLIEKEEEIVHSVPYCERCNTKVEPIADMQWFMKMDELSGTAARAVKKGEVKFVPKRWEKLYFDWLRQKRDWAISRQLWWGHRLPVWFHEPKCTPIPGREKNIEKCVEMIVAVKKPKCKYCRAQYIQSEEVLDTWFSSALWPFAVLGWPKKTERLKTFFPTNTLSTARDIINLWVGRMVFSSYEFMGKRPFEDVIIHPTVLTRDGKRMSKSLGTGIDPLELFDKYGADATRFGLTWQDMGGQDIHFAEDHIVAGKKFANKLWNATRFVLMQEGAQKVNVPAHEPEAYTAADKKILKDLKKVTDATTRDFEHYEFGPAIHRLYNFFWGHFADVYIERSKTQMVNAKTPQEKKRTLKILLYTHATTLKLLHPLMPFITEELYSHLPRNTKKHLIIEEWPE